MTAVDATTGNAVVAELPPFANEVAGTLATNAQYVLYGNIRDGFLVPPPDGPTVESMHQLLWRVLRDRGIRTLICYDQVSGITVHPEHDPAAVDAAKTVLGAKSIGSDPPLESLRAELAKVAGALGQPRPTVRAAFVIDYASRITRAPGQLSQEEHDFFRYCQKLAFSTAPVVADGSTLYNPIIWLLDGERDLPAWLTAGNGPIRTVAVGLPGLADRKALAALLLRGFPPGATNPDTPSTGRDPVTELANRTDGMPLTALQSIARLAKDRGIGADGIADAVRIHKLGVEHNPWRQDSIHEQITQGEKALYKVIRGQDRAIGKTMDILKRAALGLSGAQATSTGTRPRGILFFAGPTGTGKTELAKQTAKVLFGDEQAYLRFDMSEFAAEHAADRLAGAPPGYVGFEAGGELTGAVRRNPFRVVLFDEIEKAHPLVLDKFLQILEDGRLTDGQGTTTYFSECVLIFTSNLGILRTDRQTGERTMLVRPQTPYPELERQVKAAIKDHFTEVLGRPELLNRFGDNIVIFGFINADVAAEIVDLQLDNIVGTVNNELRIRLVITAEARNALREKCAADPMNGGRGIGNTLESILINPLARELFDRRYGPDTEVTITGLRVTDDDPALDISVGA